MTKDIKNAINLLESYMKFPYYDERFPEDGETRYVINKLKDTHKCENCSNWGQAFKTANDCKLGIQMANIKMERIKIFIVTNTINTQRRKKMTNEQLSEYKELSEKVKALIKTNIYTRANIVLVQKSNTESLGDRITNYATSVNYIIPKEEYLICRIDGHHFSAFTKCFDKPFDEALSNAMVATTRDLHNRFNCYTSFTQSDEITLFIPALKDSKDNYIEHQFGGRTDKINSLVAAFATMTFNKYLSAEYEEELYTHRENFEDSFRLTAEEEDSRKHLARFNGKLGEAYFDCRCFGVLSREEVFNVFMWRSRDCIKNSKSMFSQANVSHKELQNKNGEEQIAYCLEKTGKDWNQIEERFKYGVLVKKELYEKQIDFEKYDGPNATCTRSRLVQTSIPMNTFSPELVELISRQYLAKYK